MLNSIIQFSIRNKLIVGLMVLALIGWGSYSVTQLPIDAVPDITNNQVMVITTSPSLGAADIERLITFPIEQATRNIPGIIEQRSFSRFGLSLVTIVFDDNTDVYWARQQVGERLSDVKSQIPPELGTPTMGPVTTGLGEIFQYVVKAKPGYEKRYDAMELRTIQDWVVRRQLLGTEGIADVSSFGGKLKQYEIAVNSDKLRANNLTISDIFDALSRNNQNTGGAYIEKGPTVLYIRSEGLVRDMSDISSIPVKNLSNGTPVLIRDVADVRLGMATRYGAMCYNDQGEVAGAVVMMLKGENSSKVIEKVKEKIKEIEATLPEGVTIEPFLDRTKMVNNALGTVETNLVEGALIVILVLVFFLGNVRAGLLVASIIPLAMLFAVIMMNLFGVSGNLMSLGALDFGLIVDGTVIIVEAVMHRLHHNKHFHGLTRIDQKMMDDEVNYSTGKIMKSAAFGQAIILIVYLPFFTLQGIEGKMFKPMAQTVAFAIIGAFLLSLTYIPMMSSLVLSKKISNKKTITDKMMDAIGRWYQGILEKTLRIPKTMIAISVGLFAIAVFILTTMGGEFIPKLEEGDFAADTRVLTGSSLTTTIHNTQQTAHILLTKFPEVEKVVTKIGSGEIPTDPMPMEASDMMIILKPKTEWKSAKSYDELAEKMSTAISDVPGVTAGFQFPVQMRFNELMTGSRQDVVCKIFGENLDTLAKLAERIGNVIHEVDGAKDLYVETVTGLPQIVVDYNRPALAQYGISVEDVNRTLQAAFAGAVSGQVFENERRFDLAVRLEENSRTSPDDVGNLLIATSTGMQIPLRQVAHVETRVGPNQIQRENAQRRITVGFNVRGKDVQTVVKELQKKIGGRIKFPSGYYVTYGGQFENLVAAKKRLGVAVPVALLLILLMLYFAFNSVKQGLLIYSAIPLAAIGGVLALWGRGLPFSISAGVGFIALFGVAVLNGIVLLSEFNLLEKNGVSDIRERIIKGTRTLLRPVLMTAAVASLGFLPMALSHGAGAEVQRPLATVVIGGLVTATILTLLVLPALYLLFQDRGNKNSTSIIQRMKNRKKKNVVAGIFLLLLATVPATAQTISLQAAIDSSMKQNPAVLAAVLRGQAAKAGEKAAWNLPMTNANAEFGQINSYANDTRFGISQELAFPLVYQREKQVRQSETNLALETENQVRLETKKQVTELYYRMLVLLEKKKLLLYTDSVFAGLLQRQEERFKAGEATLLEKTSAETQRMQVADQLQRLNAELTNLQLQLAQLMNSQKLYLPEEISFRMPAPSLPDTSVLARYPVVRMMRMQEDIAWGNYRVMRSRMLPSLTFGYYNQSFTGWAATSTGEIYYGPSNRFSSFSVGVGIPLFFNAGKANIRAAHFSWEMRQLETMDVLRKKQTELQQLKVRFAKNQQSMNYYENTALKQADLLATNADLQLNNGAISFLEWLLLIDQSVGIRSNYLDAVEEWNQAVIEINTYSENK